MTFIKPIPLNTLYSLIQTNWNDDNITASVTVNFDKKAEFIRGRQSYQILIYDRMSSPTEIGRGSHIDLVDLCTIEVRVQDSSNTTFEEMVQEVMRILGDKRNAPGGDYDYVHYSVNIRDESHTGHDWWRKLIDVELKKYALSKSRNVV